MLTAPASTMTALTSLLTATLSRSPSSTIGLPSCVTWVVFEVFPRRDRQLKFRFYDDQRHLLAELPASNPSPPPPSSPAAPPLPVSVTNGTVTFTLTKADVMTNVPVQVPGLTLSALESSYRVSRF